MVLLGAPVSLLSCVLLTGSNLETGRGSLHGQDRMCVETVGYMYPVVYTMAVMPGTLLELEVGFWPKFEVHFWTPEVPQSGSKSICIFLRILLRAIPEKEDLYQGTLL